MIEKNKEIERKNWRYIICDHSSFIITHEKSKIKVRIYLLKTHIHTEPRSLAVYKRNIPAALN